MTGIIIQARMSSTRLPSKVMLKLAGKEVLWHVVQRCKISKSVDKVIVATSTDSSDDKIYNFCKDNKIEVFRGDLLDVLKRYYDCAKAHNLDIIVRVTSDCPLIDSFIIDECVRLFRASKKTPPTPPFKGGGGTKYPLLTKEGRGEVDYVSNCLERIFPRGLDCEVFSFDILEKAFNQANTESEREHVTQYIVNNGASLPYHVPPEYQGDFRLTLDEEKDYELLKIIYDKYYKNGLVIDTKEVIKFLRENPDIANINKEVGQKASIH